MTRISARSLFTKGNAILGSANNSLKTLAKYGEAGKDGQGEKSDGKWRTMALTSAALISVSALISEPSETHASSAAPAFTLPELPYARNALEPHVSAETIDYHYGKHHQAYVNNLNGLVAADPALAGKGLVDLIRAAGPGPLFNNAAQVWNHTFYWHSLSPTGGGEPTGPLADAIRSKWGTFGAFQEEFNRAAGGQFGSGWAWLVSDPAGRLRIEATANAASPVTDPAAVPLLTCDVWEHAYYIDHRNSRPAYLAAFWRVVNWEFAAANYA
eukprot:CAMPEP_0172184198 /NCGR_PEP_ID=MMETSP1050-20130122/19434_1 /TAXON_ID=233186 /ORGANISM="Cryptomonas curvata, Strain CCAP979/52" /LENGTH=270 /DNA_ID=CAMNT_0012857953 /DNA_START=81 /DNA_END=889 /DNA_ORIENTATION=+